MHGSHAESPVLPVDRQGWIVPPSWPTLPSDEVHVWRACLRQPASGPALVRTLSADEQARAGRFHFVRDRDRFVAARGLLRMILGRYLGRDPAQLRFRYGPHGKPALAAESGADDLRFNVAHAGDLALFACARGREVGVDLERIRKDLDIDTLAATAFSAGERAVLASTAPDRRREAFFAFWTLREAYVKAVGAGLTLPTDRIEVTLAHGPWATVLVHGEPPTPGRWSLRTLDPVPGYAAALAVHGDGWRLACGHWPGEDDAGVQS
jgi:4'-phosphopantetheinyl transferase